MAQERGAFPLVSPQAREHSSGSTDTGLLSWENTETQREAEKLVHVLLGLQPS